MSDADDVSCAGPFEILVYLLEHMDKDTQEWFLIAGYLEANMDSIPDALVKRVERSLD